MLLILKHCKLHGVEAIVISASKSMLLSLKVE